MSINANNRHLISHSYLTTSNWIMPACTSQSLPPLRPWLTPHFRQGWGCSRLAPSDLGLANPRIISTNPVSRVAVCFAINSTTPSTRAAVPQTSLPTSKCQRQLSANVYCPRSSHLIVLLHASSKIVQPLKYLIRGTSLTLALLSRPLREIRIQNRILCIYQKGARPS
jgi:hypothetical protein